MPPMEKPPLPSSGVTEALLDQRYSNLEGGAPNGTASLSSPAPIATGLLDADAALRLAHHGPNSLEEKNENLFLKLLSYFWGPMPIMIWLAALIEYINESWPDLAILLTLQFLNGFVSFFEEKNAGDAVAALKNSLTPKATVKREGR